MDSCCLKAQNVHHFPSGNTQIQESWNKLALLWQRSFLLLVIALKIVAAES